MSLPLKPRESPYPQREQDKKLADREKHIAYIVE